MCFRADANRMDRGEQSTPRILACVGFHRLNFDGILAFFRINLYLNILITFSLTMNYEYATLQE